MTQDGHTPPGAGTFARRATVVAWSMEERPSEVPGFVELRDGAARALVRAGYERHAELLGLAGDPPVSGMAAGGRAPHPVVDLGAGERALVRRYRRGGAMRHVNGARYFVGHRSYEELVATERARAAGVRGPLVLAAAERRRMPGYEAWIATRWIAGAQDLVGWLVAASSAGGEAALEEVGRQISAMHAGGVAHPDLNLRNVLVGEVEPGGPAIHLIDFDRARVFEGRVPEARRRRDLERLFRSARKLGALIPPGAWAALRSGYGLLWPSDLRPG